MKLYFDFYIEPVAKGRPKFFKRGKFTKAYTPKKTKKYEDALRYFFMQEYKKEPIEGAIILTAKFYRAYKKSFTKKQLALAKDNKLFPETKPDLSNYLKALEDAMNGIILKDDSLIVRYGSGTGKYFDEKPHIEITIETIEN